MKHSPIYRNGKQINDAIITPQGTFNTHPDDYIIATKDPSSLGGNGMTIVIQGDNYGINADDIAKSLYNRLRKKISS